jgi:hypothetical protein
MFFVNYSAKKLQLPYSIYVDLLFCFYFSALAVLVIIQLSIIFWLRLLRGVESLVRSTQTLLYITQRNSCEVAVWT